MHTYTLLPQERDVKKDRKNMGKQEEVREGRRGDRVRKKIREGLEHGWFFTYGG